MRFGMGRGVDLWSELLKAQAFRRQGQKVGPVKVWLATELQDTDEIRKRCLEDLNNPSLQAWDEIR